MINIVWLKRNLRLNDHKPWLSPEFCNINYPEPIVDVELAARQARNTLFEYYREEVCSVETQRVVEQHASRRYRKKRHNRPEAAPPSNQLSLF
ncbi:hypothetical protein [Lacimicrobium alkaliphilum]|uniref:Cryptochrome/DNA photolyase FAD-binding domain-containing protein n=1 Tax=Lacimicrobium alkaliphilum TaxID=1526571 RepID=A0ABQ1RJM3_9ALTE|nr:hypothetical protein [Lacimicrobium alkaliphilum]GGD69168.1 hypothetical protein GCM10011357_25290 [Lacimicrobium alkaliphilum]